MERLTDAGQATISRYARFKESVYISAVECQEGAFCFLRCKKLLGFKVAVGKVGMIEALPEHQARLLQ